MSDRAFYGGGGGGGGGAPVDALTPDDIGTDPGTVAAGDDSRIVGAAQTSANLSDLANAATARTNLGLGAAAVAAIGTTAGSVAAGNDARITGAVPATEKGAANGVATLDAGGKLTGAQAPGTWLWGPTDQGFITWNFDPTLLQVEARPNATGVLYLMRIKVPAATSITNIHLLITGAGGGSGLTAGSNWCALYTAGGVRVGQSVDQATAWASTGLATMAMSGGPKAVSAGDHYVVFCCNGTSAPNLARTGVLGGTGTQNLNMSSGYRYAGPTASTYTTTAPATLPAYNAGSWAIWTALS